MQEPDEETTDTHTGPLDDDEDARHLAADDPRRIEAEERRGKRFEDDEDEDEDEEE